MSGWCSCLFDDGVVVMTDGATWDHDAITPVRFASKATLLKRPAKGVFTARGYVRTTELIRASVVNADSFDDLIDDLPEIARDAEGRLLQYGPVVRNYDLVVAGISESRDRPEAYIMMPYDVLESGIRAYVPGRQTTGIWSNPVVSWEAMRQVGFADPPSVARLPTREDRIAFMQAMRRSPVECRDVSGRHVIRENGGGIGGFIEQTVIRRDGVTKEVVLRWPDVIGELVDPTARPTWNVNVALYGAGGGSGGVVVHDYGQAYAMTNGGNGGDTYLGGMIAQGGFGSAAAERSAGSAGITSSSPGAKGGAANGTTNLTGLDGGAVETNGTVTGTRAGHGAAEPASGGGAQVDASYLNGTSARPGVAGNTPGGGAAGAGVNLYTLQGINTSALSGGAGSAGASNRTWGAGELTGQFQIVVGAGGVAGTASGGDIAANGAKGGDGKAVLT